MDTIFAQATGVGRAGVAVIRLSGPRAFAIAAGLAGRLPASHAVGLRRLRDEAGEALDEALVLPFSGPNSFTGEDVVELHLHGSPAVTRAVLGYLSRQTGARMAEPGEFTRRALENERLDLAQVEGLADLIDAETEAQRKQALQVLSGHLGDLMERWRAHLIRAAALLEATIDFADEEVPVDVTPEVRALLSGVISALEREVAGAVVAERIREGFEVAIVGRPNVGKSTLLNALAGREAAITSATAGTTRDVVEVRMDLEGLPVTLLDTAGLRETDDEVEAIGVSRALERAKAADLRVFLARPGDALMLAPEGDDLVFHPKADEYPGVGMAVSGKTGEGVSLLISEVTRRLRDRSLTAGVATRERHRVAMEMALHGLLSAQDVVDAGPEAYDIAAEELRMAVRHLESLLGRIGVENLLDEIFSSFCIGK